LKITGVSTVVANAELRNWVFMKVTTDEPGLVGWGEPSLERNTRATTTSVLASGKRRSEIGLRRAAG
jgi:galactonate dehydratase